MGLDCVVIGYLVLRGRADTFTVYASRYCIRANAMVRLRLVCQCFCLYGVLSYYPV